MKAKDLMEGAAEHVEQHSKKLANRKDAYGKKGSSFQDAHEQAAADGQNEESLEDQLCPGCHERLQRHMRKLASEGHAEDTGSAE